MFNTRKYQLKTQITQNCYKIPSTGLLKRWTFQKNQLKSPPLLKIGDLFLNTKIMNKVVKKPDADIYTIDAEMIRAYLRNVLPDDVNSDQHFSLLVSMNGLLFSQQLKAYEWYQKTISSGFSTTIFNLELPLYFILQPKEKIDEPVFDVEEEYLDRNQDTSQKTLVDSKSSSQTILVESKSSLQKTLVEDAQKTLVEDSKSSS